MRFKINSSNKVLLSSEYLQKVNITEDSQDIYLFNGAHLPGIKEAILASGYDPENPTFEAIENAKKVCKKERAISKIITLGSQYGMGPKKMKLTLALEGINVSEEEAYEMWRAYWELYAGVKAYGKKLEREWRRNNGWILNAIGRPICCAADLVKDLVNRNIQSSAHDCHMIFLEELFWLRSQGTTWYEGIVWDFHDQVIVQCDKGDEQEVLRQIAEAERITNEKINLGLKLKLVPQVVDNLAEAKLG